MNLIVFFLFSAINISSGSLEIQNQAGSLIYFLKNGVTLQFDSTVVTSDEGIYYIDRKMGKLFGHVRLKTPSYTVTSDSLIYFEDGNRTIFRLNVSGTDSSAIFEAKNLWVLGDTAFAQGDIEIFLVNDSLAISGDSGVYFINTGKGKIFDRAKAILYQSDTINLVADSIEFRKDTLFAWSKVNINSSSFEGSSGALQFFNKSGDLSEVRLLGEGQFKIGETEVLGDTLRFSLERGHVVEAVFRGKPSLETSRDDGVLKITSENMRVSVANDTVTFFAARGRVKGRFEEK